VGALAAQEQAFNDGTDPKREEFRSDALGNRHYSEKRNFTTNTWNNPGRRKSEFNSFGQLHETYSATPAGLPDTLGYDEASMYLYDLGGNLRYRAYRLRGQGTSTVDFQQEANYYQADGKLRVFERHMGDLYQHSNDGTMFTAKGVHEQYRYDALGRRVLVWARRGPLCNHEGCESTVQRFVWDGNQLVYESRGRGADSVSSTELENENPYGNGERQQPNAYGEVVYTHAGGIDRPLAVYRATLNTTFFPHANWRSLYDGATNTSGQLIPCKNGSGVPCADSPDLDWPGSMTSAFLGATPEPRTTPAEWAGSLVMDQADASGLLYRRNRYYDPGAGRFTQPDPIGIAGGLNVYGFAKGDPVNFSDPFGLAPCPPCYGVDIGARLAAGVLGYVTRREDAIRIRMLEETAGFLLTGGVAKAFGGMGAAGRSSRSGVSAASEGVYVEGRTYVTTLGAPKPGGTGPVRVDFNVPTNALQSGGRDDWFMLTWPGKTPITGIERVTP
jgi:RHS repeat-associated protein